MLIEALKKLKYLKEEDEEELSLEEPEEDNKTPNEEVPSEEEDMFDPYDEDDLDERIKMLANELEVPPSTIENGGYDSYKVYIDSDDYDEYEIYTYKEVQDRLREYAEDDLYSNGFDNCGLDIKDYIDDEYCEDEAKDYIENVEAQDLSDEELIDYILDYGVISLDDEDWFKLKDDVDVNDEDFDKNDIDNYELLKDRQDLEQAYIEYREDNENLVDFYWEYGLGDWLSSESFSRRDCPWYINLDRAINDLADTADAGQYISTDGYEIYLGTDSNGNDLYAYKIS